MGPGEKGRQEAVTNRSKEKGTAAETVVVKYLREKWGLSLVERRALSGTKDRGDIAGIPGVVIEVKDAIKHNMPEWKGQTLDEIANDNAEIGALVIKVKYKAPADWDAWVPFWMIHCHDDVVHPGDHYSFWVKMTLGEFVRYLQGEGYVQ